MLALTPFINIQSSYTKNEIDEKFEEVDNKLKIIKAESNSNGYTVVYDKYYDYGSDKKIYNNIEKNEALLKVYQEQLNDENICEVQKNGIRMVIDYLIHKINEDKAKEEEKKEKEEKGKKVSKLKKFFNFFKI